MLFISRQCIAFMQSRAQSAIEFMSVYAVVLLVIAIMIAVLVFFINIPRTVLPVECTYFNTFTCADAVLAVNGTHGATLLVDSVDSVPGVINVSEFRAFLSFQNSKPGYCVPNMAQQGQTIYCVANFNFTPSISQTYFGTFDIYANYCAASPAALLSVPCPANKNYTFAGNIRVQPSSLVLKGVNTTTNGNATGLYVPISVANNNGGSAAPAHFQEEITFDPQSYALLERPDLGNIRFYYGSRELYSWCESGCSSTSTSVVFWVKMPVAVPPGKNRTVEMYFLPFTATYTGKYAGEAPQLSPTYGEYDNGAQVFSEYWNFQGTTLPTGMVAVLDGGSVTVNDGLTLAPGSGFTDVYYNFNITTPSVAEAYVRSDSASDAAVFFSTNGIALTPSTGANIYNGYLGGYSSGSTLAVWKDTNGFYSGLASGGGSTYPSIISLLWGGTGNEIAESNYGGAISSTDSTFPVGSGYYVGLTSYNHGTSPSATYTWLRVRMYPPGGIMPVTTFGNVVTVA